MNNKIKIMICCHKKCELPDDDMFLPIQVGKAISKIDLYIQSDNEFENKKCDNISDLNNIFCEMTAAYWAWKNIETVFDNIDYIGLCHYRRYFYYYGRTPVKDKAGTILAKIKQISKVIINQGSFFAYDNEIRVSSLKNSKFYSSNNCLKNMIPKYDAVATEPITIIGCDVRGFFNIIGSEYLNLLDNILLDNYPEYYQIYLNIMKGNKLSCANMIILKKEYYNLYCEFIFGALFKHVEMCKVNNIVQDPYHEKIYNRVSGYLAEILTYVFIKKMEYENRKVGYVNKLFLQ